MSLTIVVPAEVPSELHNSIPAVEVETANRSLPFILANIRGKLPVAPDTMSFTMYVPAAVPSERQSSDPYALPPSVAGKYRTPLTRIFKDIELLGTPSPAPGLMSFTKYVPASVPSVRQSS